MKRVKARARRALPNLALMLGSLLVLLIVLNLIYAAFLRGKPEEEARGESFHRRSVLPGVVSEHVPGARTRAQGVEVVINSYGFRDHEFSVDKPEGVCRIVALGDSVTFGQGVPLEATFPKRLESMLNEEAPEGIRFEVLNAGVQGYNTAQEAVVLRHRILPLDPDLVILGFTETNDPEITTLEPYSLRKVLGKVSVVLKLPLFGALADRLERKRTAEEWTQFTRDIYRPDGEPWQNCVRALRSIRDDCQESGIPLVVALFPLLHPEDLYKPQREQLKETLDDLDMPFLDMHPRIRDIPMPAMHVSETDQHPSAKVHGRFADVILEWMRAHPPCRGVP